MESRFQSGETAEEEQMDEKLWKGIAFFTRESRIMDGMHVVCGQGARRAEAWDGREIGPRTVYDLASVTKIFTGLCLARLWEERALEPWRRVTEYCPEFPGLRTVTVEQLMGFQRQIRTEKRIDGQRDREAALRCLRTAEDQGPAGPRAYSDIPPMILKYVIERITGSPLAACVRKLVLAPAGMEETWAEVPADRRGDCLCYGPEYRIEGDAWIRREAPRRGVPHDPKAALLQGASGDLCGHAGLFATAGDLEKLARAILAEKIVGRESLRRMAVNRTGRQRPGGSYTQYLGYCCYRKHPDQYYSEIPADMTQEAFGIGGFTGNHFSVDPGSGRYTILLGNRVRDRLTVLLPPEGKTRRDYGLREDGSGEIRWTDGSLHPSSVDYVHQKDARLHAVIAAWAREGEAR